jgi:ATP-dependent Clp protease protease subunit
MNEILIYDDIGESWFSDGVTGKKIKEQLDEINGDVIVRINSGGGDVFEGIGIYNILKEHKGNVTIKIDGWAASAASIIAMAGDTVSMAFNSQMMIHNPWTFAAGDASELTKVAERLESIKGNLVDTYEARTGIGEEKISTWMNEEKWFTATEAIEYGFADADEEIEAKIAAFSRPWIKNAPKPKKIPELSKNASTLTVAPEKIKEIKENTISAQISSQPAEEETKHRLSLQEKRLNLLKE